MNIQKRIKAADKRISDILANLESDLKEEGMKISHVSVARHSLGIFGQLETEQPFEAEVHVQIRR